MSSDSDSDRRQRSGNPAGEAGRRDAALGRLEERLDRASEAAERLITEAATRLVTGEPPPHDQSPAAGAQRRPPPAGWQRPPRDEPAAGRGDTAADDAGSRSSGEIELLLRALGALRDRIPPELQHRLGEALREVLLALRALIDWYLERTERRGSAPAEVQDIPIL